MPNAPAGVEWVGHRGSPTLRTENTLSSFLLALDHGAHAVELDAHVTSDGVVVVHHDETVAGRAIAATQWEELIAIPLPDRETIPRLEDVLLSLDDWLAVYIELKGANIEDAVIGVAREWGFRFALHSFDHDAIARVAAKAPDIARGVLLDRGTSRPTEALRRAVERVQPRDVWPHWSLVDDAFMAAARETKTRVIPWTVNDREIARKLMVLGVDALCTDDVRMLADLDG
jgi:glycerophosphoryl diester phosphodiesterase